MRVFGIEPKVEYRKNFHVTNVYINSVPITKIFHRLFGKGATNKRIPDLFFSLQKDKLRLLVEWMVKGDGYVGSNAGKPYIRYSSVSRELFYIHRNQKR